MFFFFNVPRAWLCIHVACKRAQVDSETTLSGSDWISFTIFFPSRRIIPINFNFHWQPLTAKKKDFLPFYWDRLAKSVAAIYRLKITFVNPPTHTHPPSLLTRTQCKQPRPWMKNEMTGDVCAYSRDVGDAEHTYCWTWLCLDLSYSAVVTAQD